MPSDNETWIIDEGDSVIEKKAQLGYGELTARDKMVYCLWVVDYSIRNAGDLDTAEDMMPEIRKEAARLARELRLSSVTNAFELNKEDFEAQYHERFDDICSEIR